MRNDLYYRNYLIAYIIIKVIFLRDVTLGMTDEHEELLSCGSGWWMLPVWVYELWLVRMDPDRLPSLVISWWFW